MLSLLSLAMVSRGLAALTSKDALLVIDVQNDFIASWTITGDINFTEWPDLQGSKVVPQGALGVSDGAGIIPLLNAWMPEFDNVFASLDWHPDDACSFSSSGGVVTVSTDCETNATGCDASWENRCTDPVSVADYKRETGLTQWAKHCVQGEFGSKFPPTFDFPSTGKIVKKGFVPELDSYSVFGGVEAIVNSDMGGDNVTTLSDRKSFKTLLEELGIERLWVTGIATDFCVKNTVLDALGINVAGPSTKPSTITTVIVLEAGVRGVNDVSSAAAIELFKTSGVVVVPAALTTWADIMDYVEESSASTAATGLALLAALVFLQM